ncbi:MAG: tRNA threonylcarbamoyladenosine dehydratase [Burkholderiales bacterium]|nr:tRNA threonylcarbamoyladenosine dehydratase [Burkholderiales bacterium]MDE2287139.1 tRNA threonylcarbamoyladenosine dehydratase [Burkholderiales bacterium]MDE2610119.1 tRNA threonylcarbamoyladenosine dehydratase [Burkholderiales bacterium]
MGSAFPQLPLVDSRRFGGIARLYGDAGLAALRAAHVCVIGIGGVGSWVAEALARSAVGRLTLIDLDHVAESNTNRQIHALEGNYGKAKVLAMAERIGAINPQCQVTIIEDFAELDNLDDLLAPGFDWIIDAIDNVRVKAALIAWAGSRAQPIITVGGAGGQLDPTRIRIDDLARTIQDPLLSKVRARLRRVHGYARGPKAKFGVPAVYSDEPLIYPDAACAADGEPATGPQGLNCAGFGASMCVTAGFGLAASAYVLRRLAGK